jgi:hypothetical protein
MAGAMRIATILAIVAIAVRALLLIWCSPPKVLAAHISLVDGRFHSGRVLSYSAKEVKPISQENDKKRK